MIKYLKILIATAAVGALVLASLVYGATFAPALVGANPIAGSVLQTNGSVSTWVTTSSLGISGGTVGPSTSTYVAVFNASETITGYDQLIFTSDGTDGLLQVGGHLTSTISGDGPSVFGSDLHLYNQALLGLSYGVDTASPDVQFYAASPTELGFVQGGQQVNLSVPTANHLLIGGISSSTITGDGTLSTLGGELKIAGNNFIDLLGGTALGNGGGLQYLNPDGVTTRLLIFGDVTNTLSIYSYDTQKYTSLDMSALTANHTFIFPDKDGTLALLSDITGGVATSGTPVAGQVAFFDPDGNTITGDGLLTYSTGLLTLTGTFRAGTFESLPDSGLGFSVLQRITAGDGQDIAFYGGNASGTGNGSNILFSPGQGRGGGKDGSIKFQDSQTGNNLIWNINNLLTADIDLTPPNRSGTLALLSDITGGGSSTVITSASSPYLTFSALSGGNQTATLASVLSLLSSSTAGYIDFSAATGTGITAKLHSLNISQLTNDSSYATSGAVALKADKATTISAGGILSGGGDLSTNRSISFSTSTLYSQFSAAGTGLTYNTSTGQYTWTNPGYISANQNISLTGAVTGSGATSIATTFTTSTLYGLFSSVAPLSYSNTTGAFSLTTTTFLMKADNLAGLASTSTARTSLGLGDSATKNVGASAGTVAAGDDSRITGAVQTSRNVSTAGILSGGGDLSADRTITLTTTTLNTNVAALGYVTSTTSGVSSFNTQTGAAVYGVTSANSYATVATSTTNATITIAPTLASSSYKFGISNATTTGNTTIYAKWHTDQQVLISNLWCQDTVATTTLFIFVPTSDSTTTVSSTIASAFACGTTAHTSSTNVTLAYDTPIIAMVTSTLGTPVTTNVQIRFQKQ